MNYSRQLELYDADNRQDSVYIIGAGATGSWLTLILGKLGVDNISVIDYDVIEEHNLPNQFFKNNQVGMFKVNALQKNMNDYYSKIGKGINKQVAAVGTPPNTDIGTFSYEDLKAYIQRDTAAGRTVTVFCLVDSMKARKEILEGLLGVGCNAIRFIETRMGLTGYRIYDIDLSNNKEIEKYKETLYSDEDAEVSACGTSQSIVSTAMQCASHAVGLWLGNMNNVDYIPNELIFDIQSSVLLTNKFDKGEE